MIESMKAAAILTGFVLLAVTLGFAAQKPRRQFCTTDGRGDSVMCYCLSYHPDFCSSEGPIPSCCKVTEEGSEVHECRCCGSGHKAATLQERGKYQHIR